MLLSRLYLLVSILIFVLREDVTSLIGYFVKLMSLPEVLILFVTYLVFLESGDSFSSKIVS